MVSSENIWCRGKLLKVVQSFYSESRSCVKGESGMSEWCSVEVGLGQGCMMSPWLFNTYTWIETFEAVNDSRAARLVGDIRRYSKHVKRS